MHHAPPLILFDPDPAAAPVSDCNCACAPVGHTPPPPAPHPGARLRSHPQLRQIPLTTDLTVSFVPSWSRVAVLNAPARQLLQSFAHARPYASSSECDAVTQLLQLGLLVDADQPPAPPAPDDELSAWLHVTNACNLRCTYCYVDKTDEAMAPATGLAAIDTLLQTAHRYGYRRLLLKYAGGEASLNLPLVEHLHRHASARAAEDGLALRGVVLSNGVALGRSKLERIRALGLSLMVSLDGPPGHHDAQRPRLGGQGSARAAAAAILRARELGLDLTVSITVTGASVAGLPALLDWLLEREIHFSLNFYRACAPGEPSHALQLEEHRLVDGMRAAYRTVERRLPAYSLLGSLLDRANLGTRHERPCAAGADYLVIDHHGAVARCQMELDRPVTTIWSADPLHAIRLEPGGLQNLPVDAKEGCRDCEWRYWCAGGCALATFRATGRFDVRSPNCGIYQALYPEVLRLEGLRLLQAAARREVAL